ncbi:heavy-metal-associated domain-containing protein [Pontibacter qinzhouensis]|uniref:Heavy-metal-associated domain-containing protein n=1 Tax=Pontibacter qinzhouensis TaxID=2603253 RepID=A0A5C8K6S6_9BACT|nr:heavy-metal-associated domain-containing protein [Pontibacter qinzhouensis]TXK44464.1 heavy-metal-associated domain-containing protein [Pontibacter qinzhouensis]
MKNLKAIFFAFTMFMLSTAVQAQSQKKGEETVQIKTSAVCSMCKKTLEKAMAYEKGVKSSSLDVKSKMFTVVYDSKKTNPENIIKAVNATGYDADDKPAQERAYNRLDDCCKKEAGDH